MFAAFAPVPLPGRYFRILHSKKSRYLIQNQRKTLGAYSLYCLAWGWNTLLLLSNHIHVLIFLKYYIITGRYLIYSLFNFKFIPLPCEFAAHVSAACSLYCSLVDPEFYLFFCFFLSGPRPLTTHNSRGFSSRWGGWLQFSCAPSKRRWMKKDKVFESSFVCLPWTTLTGFLGVHFLGRR